MASYTVSERDMIITIPAILEDEGESELAAIIRVSKFVYNPQWEYSGIISNQKKLYATIKVPINFKKLITDRLDVISKAAISIYDDDDDYYFLGINNIGVLPIQTEEVEYQNKHIVLEKDSVFSNFIKFLAADTSISSLQKRYLFEACENGNSNNLLSATVMLGCSAEILLKELCDSYYLYLKNNGTEAEQNNFDNKVLKAKVAYTRLDEFLKRIETNPAIFNNLGFENIRLNFNFMDIIRQTRNDSGHPTGNTITQEQFKMMVSNYQSFLVKAVNAINILSTMNG